MAYVEQCEEDFAMHDEDRGAGIDIGLGQNACPAVLLYHPSGHTAVVRSSPLVANLPALQRIIPLRMGKRHACRVALAMGRIAVSNFEVVAACWFCNV